MELRRRMIEQEAETFVDGWVGDAMIVVKNKRDILGVLGQRIEQFCQRRLNLSGGGAQQRQGRCANPGAGSLKCGADVAPEATWVVVALVEGQPGGLKLRM